MTDQEILQKLISIAKDQADIFWRVAELMEELSEDYDEEETEVH